MIDLQSFIVEECLISKQTVVQLFGLRLVLLVRHVAVSKAMYICFS